MDSTSKLIHFCRNVMSDNDFNVYSSQTGLTSQFRKWSKVYHPDKGGNPDLYITVSDCKNILLNHFDSLMFYNQYPFLSNAILHSLVNFCLDMVLFLANSLISSFIYSIIFRLLFGIIHHIQNVSLPIWLKRVIFKQKNMTRVSNIIRSSQKKKSIIKRKKRSTKKKTCIKSRKKTIK